MNTDKSKLEDLIKEKDNLLNLYKDVSFPTEEEIVSFIKQNQTSLKRLKDLQNEIRELKFKLMTPKEKLEYLEEQKNIKEKYSDD